MIILLDSGHGLDKEGKYQRPLIDCTSGKAIIVPNSMKPHPNDHSPTFYREDFGTLEIAKAARIILESMGHKVYLTREDNRDVSLYQSDHSTNQWRINNWPSWKWTLDLQKTTKADIFVSIHTNAGKGTGCAAFWSMKPNGPNLCKYICNEISKQFNLKIRNIAQHNYTIIKNVCKGNACLVECLFHDNYADIHYLLNQQGIDNMAKAISVGIDNHAKTI